MKINFIIDRFEGDQAVLVLDRRTVVWPKDLIPPHAKEGDGVVFAIGEETDSQSGQNKLSAKEIINELLGNS